MEYFWEHCYVGISAYLFSVGYVDRQADHLARRSVSRESRVTRTRH